MMDDYEKTKASTKGIRYLISFSAIILMVIHVLFPYLRIDAITIILIFISILPWLDTVFKTFEIPGVVKVEYNYLRNSTKRAQSVGLLAPAKKKKDKDLLFIPLAKENPNLALAGLRIEIEKKLSRLAESYNVKEPQALGVRKLLETLTRINVLTDEQRFIISDIIGTLNKAVHGAEIDKNTANWAIHVGPRLLSSLDIKISERKLNLLKKKMR